jgi:hypothetical protein
MVYILLGLWVFLALATCLFAFLKKPSFTRSRTYNKTTRVSDTFINTLNLEQHGK